MKGKHNTLKAKTRSEVEEGRTSKNEDKDQIKLFRICVSKRGESEVSI